MKKIKTLLQKALASNTLHTATKLYGARYLHCIGDSHLAAFQFTASNYFWLHTVFCWNIVQGATASGLANPNSKTHAFDKFKAYIGSLSEPAHMLFCLGEVDCGFVIWYRAEKYKSTVDEQFQLSLKNYIDFIKNTAEEKCGRIIVNSVPLPTILDNQSWGEIANLRREIHVSIRDRTDLTIEYNKRLRQICQDNGYSFLDLEAETLDPKTQLLKDCFRNSNKLDHHLNSNALAPHIRKKLLGLGYW
jgi:hypothetical protein